MTDIRRKGFLPKSFGILTGFQTEFHTLYSNPSPTYIKRDGGYRMSAPPAPSWFWLYNMYKLRWFKIRAYAYAQAKWPCWDHIRWSKTLSVLRLSEGACGSREMSVRTFPGRPRGEERSSNSDMRMPRVSPFEDSWHSSKEELFPLRLF